MLQPLSLMLIFCFFLILFYIHVIIHTCTHSQIYTIPNHSHCNRLQSLLQLDVFLLFFFLFFTDIFFFRYFMVLFPFYNTCISNFLNIMRLIVRVRTLVIFYTYHFLSSLPRNFT